MVTPGDFTVTNPKIGKKNLYLTESQLVRNKNGVWQIITVICVPCVQKDFWI